MLKGLSHGPMNTCPTPIPENDWFNLARGIEALEDAPLDAELVSEFQHRFASFQSRPLDCHLPGFKSYRTDELEGRPDAEWPAVSVTGSDCALRCDHCRGRILEPMTPAREPAELEAELARLAGSGARGVLITGGSDRQNTIDYGPFLPAIRRIKASTPGLLIAMHTGLVDRGSAEALAEAGIDIAMLDIIGAQETVEQVYHLRRPVADFEHSLAALTSAGLRVVPHIVVGLHYGRLLGEWKALRMVQSHGIHAAVLVVAMPQYASRRRPFSVPEPREVGAFFRDAREALADVPLHLGCARPAGAVKSALDAYAVMAGFDGIAHPADGIVRLAEALGRPVRAVAGCCSMGDRLAAFGGAWTVTGGGSER